MSYRWWTWREHWIDNNKCEVEYNDEIVTSTQWHKVCEADTVSQHKSTNTMVAQDYGFIHDDDVNS